MRRQSELKVMPREESGRAAEKPFKSGGFETDRVTNVERGILTTLGEMERAFEETLHRPFFGFNMAPWRQMFQGFSSFGEFSPSVDIYDEGNYLVVKAEVPGIPKESINVDFYGNTICISGEKKAEEKVERKGYFRSECTQGAFRRTLTLPEGVDYGKAKASYKDGVLEVQIPKAGEKSSVRHIPIQ
jgi:HSP20 family protein